MVATRYDLNMVAGAVEGELRGDARDIQKILEHLGQVWDRLEGCHYPAFHECIGNDIIPARMAVRESLTLIETAAIRLNEERKRIG